MNAQPPADAAPESYPTFWDAGSFVPSADPIPAEDAYTAFVSLVEDEFPSDVDATEAPEDEDPNYE